MKLASVVLGLSALAGVNAAQCSVAGLTPGDIGSVTGSGGCMCDSGFYGSAGTCTAWGDTLKTSQCPSGFPAAITDSGALTATVSSDLTTVNQVGSDQLVTLKISIPAQTGRKYSAISVLPKGAATGQGAACAAGSAFETFQVAQPGTADHPATDGCNDLFVAKVLFTKLRSCGFNRATLTAAEQETYAGYEVYDGVIHVEYNDGITFGADSNFPTSTTRNMVVDFPMRIKFDSNYVAEMSAFDTTVYATEKVDFAVTGQSIPKDGNSAPTAIISYTTQFPYTISLFEDKSSEIPTTGVPAIAIASVDAPTKCTVDATTSGADSDVTTFKASNTASEASCTKTTTVTFSKTDAETVCLFNNFKYRLGFTIQCPASVSPADCPLQADSVYSSTAPNSAAAPKNAVEFTLTSEQFCAGAGAEASIDNVIAIDSFVAFDAAGTRTGSTLGATQNAWRWNDPAYFKMVFSGLPIYSLTVAKLESKYGASTTTYPSSWSTVFDRSAANGDAARITAAGFDDASTGLGLVTPTATSYPFAGTSADKGHVFYFKVNLVDAVLSPGASTTTEPVRGQDQFLRLQATVDVSYFDGTVATRRRRRQVTGPNTSGSGTKESDDQTIQATEAAEAAPNSAVRAAPAVALVLALLSAVALL